MGSNATASTAAASGGVAGAAVVILVWLLGLMHVTMPADVAAAVMVVLSAALHAGVLKYMVPSLDEEIAAAAPAVVPSPVAASPAPAPAAPRPAPVMSTPVPVARPVAPVP